MFQHIKIVTNNKRVFSIRPHSLENPVFYITARDYAAKCILRKNPLETIDLLIAMKYVQEIDAKLSNLSDEEQQLLSIVYSNSQKFDFYQKQQIRTLRTRLLEDVIRAGYKVSENDTNCSINCFIRDEITGNLRDGVENYVMFRTFIIVGNGIVSLVFDPQISPHCEIKLFNLYHPTAQIDHNDMTLRSFPMNSIGFLEFINELVPVSKQTDQNTPTQDTKTDDDNNFDHDEKYTDDDEQIVIPFPRKPDTVPNGGVRRAFMGNI